MDWSQFWNGFTPNYLDFWRFFRPFVYGGVGGISLFLMSYINISSSLVQTKNKLQFSSSTTHSKRAQKANAWRSRFFRIKVAAVHFVVGGVSGMIAVNSFNPTANELQTFSIAVIAGLSGFAFLKRSALADDSNSEKLLDVEEESLNLIEEDLYGLVDKIIDSAGIEQSISEKNADLLEQIEEIQREIEIENVESPTEGGLSELDEFLIALKNAGLMTDKDIIYYKNLTQDGYTDDQVIQLLIDIIDEI